MTLIVGAIGERSIWMLADRRLSIGAKVIRDDAVKLINLETKDGLALLGYSGLGASSSGVEPSEWMSKTIRGLNLPLEKVLGIISNAAVKRLPRHLSRICGSAIPAHHIIIPAFLNGDPRIYSIDLALIKQEKKTIHRYTKHVMKRNTPSGDISVRLATGGSGALTLKGKKAWQRHLLRLINAHDAGRISPNEVSKYFAEINHFVSKSNRTVSSECLVTWKLADKGGNFAFYKGVDIDQHPSNGQILHIDNGLVVNDLANALMPFVEKQFKAMNQGKEFKLDKEEIDKELKKLPENPDDTFA